MLKSRRSQNVALRVVHKLIRPNNDGSTLFVLEGTDNNHNKIDNRPNEQASEGKNLEYARSNLADIKPVYAKHSEEPAQQKRCQPAPRAGVRRLVFYAGRRAAVRTGWRQA